MRIERSELRIGRKLGEGSQGAVFEVEGSWDGLPFPSLIYKEFAPGTQVSGPALEVLAALRDNLSGEARSVIDAYTVWPVAVVFQSGRISGYLMQEIPPQFLQSIATSNGTDVIPREIQHLFVADAITMRNLGEAPTRQERFALCREMAFAVGFLHGRNVVFGDLSYRNAVYALRPRPSVMLLDCDAVRIEGQGAAVQQLNSPGWTAPERAPQTKQTDRYKLGLFVLRCCTPEVNAQTRDPEKARGVLDNAGMALLRRALSPQPGERASGREWVEHFDSVLARGGGIHVRRDPPPSPGRPAYRLARPGEHVPRVPGGIGAGTPPAPARTPSGNVSRPGGRVPAFGGRPGQPTAPVSVMRTAPTYVPAPPGRPGGGAWVRPTRVRPHQVTSLVPPRAPAGVSGSAPGSNDGWKVVGILWAVAIALGLVAVFAAASSSSGTSSTSTSRAAAPFRGGRTGSSLPAAAGAGSSSAAPAPGATITGETPCPAADGSSPRTTSFSQAPPLCIDLTRTYIARIATTAGELAITLDTRSPLATNNFVVLSRYHYYDGVAFHRVLPGFVVQGGDATGSPPGSGGPGYTFADELPGSPAEYQPRTVAMANSGPDTNGSQFFVVLAAGRLDARYSIFGQVTVGFDSTIAAIASGTSAGEPPTEPTRIRSVTITEA